MPGGEVRSDCIAVMRFLLLSVALHAPVAKPSMDRNSQADARLARALEEIEVLGSS